MPISYAVLCSVICNINECLPKTIRSKARDTANLSESQSVPSTIACYGTVSCSHIIKFIFWSMYIAYQAVWRDSGASSSIEEIVSACWGGKSQGESTREWNFSWGKQIRGEYSSGVLTLVPTGWYLVICKLLWYWKMLRASLGMETCMTFAPFELKLQILTCYFRDKTVVHVVIILHSLHFCMMHNHIYFLWYASCSLSCYHSFSDWREKKRRIQQNMYGRCSASEA